MTSEEVARKLFEKIIEDAKDRFTLEPGESIEYECSDDYCDGVFENFIHHEFDDWGCSHCFENSDVNITFHESHH